MRPVAVPVCAMRWALCALAACGAPAHAAEPARWRATGAEIREPRNSVHLPRFSPDSRALAYAVSVPSGEAAFAEIRRYGLRDRATTVLLPLAETRAMADWGAYPTAIRWTGPDTLTAEVSNGDDGHNVYALKAGRRGSLWHRSLGAEDEAPPAPDPALRALAPDWPGPVFANAMQSMVRIRPHGALVQKRYAGQDGHLWWLDLQRREARVALPAPGDAALELMQGFAFGRYAVFALRRGGTVTAQRLAADGTLREIAGSRVSTDIGPEAVGTGVGAVDHRRCSSTVCWAAYRIRRDDRSDTRILRVDRQGVATVLAPIEGLEDFDVSPDFKRLAVAVVRDGERAIRLFDIVAF